MDQLMPSGYVNIFICSSIDPVISLATQPPHRILARHRHLMHLWVTDCVNPGTHNVTSSFKPASLNPKTASRTQF